jgi:predicted nucleotidyltransferase
MRSATIIKKLQKKSIQKRFLNNQITHLWLFWSHAKNNAGVESDIDLLYERDESLVNTWGDFWFFWLIADMKEYLWKPLDLLSIKHIDPLIKDEILSSKVEIW